MKKCKCLSAPNYHREDCAEYDVYGKPKAESKTLKSGEIDPNLDALLEAFECMLDNSQQSSSTTHLVIKARKINDAANN